MKCLIELVSTNLSEILKWQVFTLQPSPSGIITDGMTEFCRRAALMQTVIVSWGTLPVEMATDLKLSTSRFQTCMFAAVHGQDLVQHGFVKAQIGKTVVCPLILRGATCRLL